MDSKLKGEILNDIKKSGFLSELLVASELVKDGWEVRNCVTYLDKDELIKREIDIIAFQYRFNEKQDLSIELTLAIEVKNTNDKPWIIYTIPVNASPSNLVPHRSSMLVYNHGLENDVVTYDLLTSDYMRSDIERVGISFHEAFKKENSTSQIYKALITSCKAAEYNMDDLLAVDEKLKGLSFRELALFQPVVVLNGKLIEATLDETGEVILNERHFIPIMLGGFSPKYKPEVYYPDIVTIDGLSDYFRKLKAWLSSIEQNILNKLANL